MYVAALSSNLLGVLDLADMSVETPVIVADRIRRALLIERGSSIVDVNAVPCRRKAVRRALQNPVSISPPVIQRKY